MAANAFALGPPERAIPPKTIAISIFIPTDEPVDVSYRLGRQRCAKRCKTDPDSRHRKGNKRKLDRRYSRELGTDRISSEKFLLSSYLSKIEDKAADKNIDSKQNKPEPDSVKDVCIIFPCQDLTDLKISDIQYFSLQ